MSKIRNFRFTESVCTVQAGDMGMTLVEMIFAMIMLVAFGAIFVAVATFTSNFMGSAQSSKSGSQGLFIDRHELTMAMDRLALVLGQPALNRLDVVTIVKQGCTADPINEWKLPGVALAACRLNGPRPCVPTGYRFCLASTSLAEPNNLAQFFSASPTPKPGIYILRAVPETVSFSSLPVRRLICRPRPFC